MRGDVVQLPSVTSADTSARWLAIADAALLAAGAAGDHVRPDRGIDGVSAATVRPCSLPLSALPALFDEVRDTLQHHTALTKRLTAELGPRRALLLDHCWVRHQPAPRHRATGQTPHSWHQDGALAFDFSAPPPYPADALLPMWTCWLSLTDCGTEAPSLAWYEPPLDHLLEPLSLSDDALHAWRATRVSTTQRHAVMSAGDALLFGGGLLHRTHASAAMTQARTSIELRWLPAHAVPQRLAGGRITIDE